MTEKFELEHDKRNISDSDLLSDLRRVAAEHTTPHVKQRDYTTQGKFSVTTIIRRFGSWNAAISAAGLAATVERNVPDERLYAALYDLWMKLGRQPSYSEVQSPMCEFHVTTFERRFGSWRSALEAFVGYANAEQLANPSQNAGLQTSSRRKTNRAPDLRLRFKVLQRDGFKCRACGASPAITAGVLLRVDHITPWSKGGETVLSNLQTLCDECNQGKSNHA